MEKIKIYHLCISCNEGLLFRSRHDYIRFVNNMALLANKYKIRILAYSVMSNHFHIGVMTGGYDKFLQSLKRSYSNYYRCRYGTRIPENKYMVTSASGNVHILTMLSYILRNPVHHGLAGHPFGYPYSSARCYFAYDFQLYSIGRAPTLKRTKTIMPEHFFSDREGMIDPHFFVDEAMVENLFGTSGKFMYFMSRHSGPKWEFEQQEEAEAPVTLETIEGSDIDLNVCLQNERGHAKLLIPDQLLCEYIDGIVVSKAGKYSYVELSDSERINIAYELKEKWHVKDAQISRVLYREEK